MLVVVDPVTARVELYEPSPERTSCAPVPAGRLLGTTVDELEDALS